MPAIKKSGAAVLDPLDQKTSCLMAVVRGLKTKEVSEQLGIPVHEVRSNAHQKYQSLCMRYSNLYFVDSGSDKFWPSLAEIAQHFSRPKNRETLRRLITLPLDPPAIVYGLTCDDLARLRFAGLKTLRDAYDQAAGAVLETTKISKSLRATVNKILADYGESVLDVDLYPLTPLIEKNKLFKAQQTKAIFQGVFAGLPEFVISYLETEGLKTFEDLLSCIDTKGLYELSKNHSAPSILMDELRVIAGVRFATQPGVDRFHEGLVLPLDLLMKLEGEVSRIERVIEPYIIGFLKANGFNALKTQHNLLEEELEALLQSLDWWLAGYLLALPTADSLNVQNSDVYYKTKYKSPPALPPATRWKFPQ